MAREEPGSADGGGVVRDIHFVFRNFFPKSASDRQQLASVVPLHVYQLRPYPLSLRHHADTGPHSAGRQRFSLPHFPGYPVLQLPLQNLLRCVLGARDGNLLHKLGQQSRHLSIYRQCLRHHHRRYSNQHRLWLSPDRRSRTSLPQTLALLVHAGQLSRAQ